MEFTKTLKEYEKDLKGAKKSYDKLTKKINKCTSEYQYENLMDQCEILYEEISELNLIIEELRNRKRKELEYGDVM
jgi:predicted  nucleic acid-binding Zn-ribbon protein